MKKLLSMLGTITLIGTVSTNIIACGKGDEPSPTPIPPLQAEFQKVNGWKDTNGSVFSLVNVNGTVYAETKTVDGQGKLFKSKTDGTFELVSGWKEDNGEVYRLVNVNGTVYAGTRTAADKGNLYKKSK
ncbi:lipoprotein [Spiroplasma ixodetis]|uniref:lipoprotein n=1 Tax=Spiroplasma ixodetis TaxID=2141 RepID=UPI0025788A94|nr:lipoprotein [Spiroplasma ixodetis]WJG69356.1 hypothetical protein SIXOD_v1c02040 [Spiroplasma ixodetis Y32]